MPDVRTVVTAGLDASDYEAGARRVEAANQRIEASTRALQNVGERTQQGITDAGRAYDAMVRQLDSAARAAAAYATAERQNAATVEAASIVRERGNRSLESTRAGYAQMRPAFEEATGQMQRQDAETGNLSASLTNLGGVVQDNVTTFNNLADSSGRAQSGFGSFDLILSALQRSATSSSAALGFLSVGFVALGASTESNLRSLNSLSVGLQRTRDDYTGLTQQIDGAARVLADTTVYTTQQARDALAKLATVPNFNNTTENLLEMGKLARDLGAAFGETVVQGADRLADALRDPAAAAKRYLDDGKEAVRGFDAEFRRHIDLLIALGKPADAASEVTERFTRALRDAGERATPLQASWRNLSETMSQTANNATGQVEGIGTAITNGLAGAIGTLTQLVALFDRVNNQSGGRLGRAFFSLDMGYDKIVPEDWQAEIQRIIRQIEDQSRLIFGNGRLLPGRRNINDLGDVPADMRAPIDEAARAADVDPTLLARVYGREAVRRPDGSFATSPAGAVGAFQLMPRTYDEVAARYGLPTGAEGINDTRYNALAGAYYLRERIDARQGDVVLGLADYNAGPRRVDQTRPIIPPPPSFGPFGEVLPPAGTVRGPHDLSRLPRETREYISSILGDGAFSTGAREMLGGYGLNGEDLVTAEARGMVNASTPTPLRRRSYAYPVPMPGVPHPEAPLMAPDELPLPPPQPPPPGSPELRPRPLLDDEAARRESTLNDFRERSGGGAMESRRALLGERLRTAEADQAVTPEGTRDFADRKAMIEGLRSELEKIKPVESAFTEGMVRTNRAGQELDPTLRAVREKVGEFDAQMRAAGKVVDGPIPDPEVIAGRARVVRETLDGLRNTYNQQFDTVQRQTAAQDRIADAYLRGTDAGKHQENAERAIEEVRKSGIVGTDARRAAEEALTREYDRQAEAKQRADSVQMLGRRIQDQGVQMQGIAMQSGLVFAGPRALAEAEAEKDASRLVVRALGPAGLERPDAQAFLANARTIAQMNLDLKQQVASWHAVETAVGSAIDRMGSATVDLLNTGKWEDFRKAGVAVLLDLEKEFLKLAVLNPIKNAIFGSTQPTLNSLGGSVGSLFGGGGSTAPTSFSVTGTGTAGGFSGGLEGLQAGLPIASAKGNVFDAGYVVAFAKGGELVDRPTTFPMAGGQTGLMGEAGPEAIMPLRAGPGGKPGVRVLFGGDEIVLPLARTASGDLAVQAFGKGGIAAILGGGVVGAIGSNGGLGGAFGMVAGGALGGTAMRGGGAAMVLGGAGLGARGDPLAALGGAGLVLADDDKRDELEGRLVGHRPFGYAAGGAFVGGAEYGVGPATADSFAMPLPARMARLPTSPMAPGRAPPRMVAQVNMNIKAQDADSFRRSRGQVVATMARGLGAATRRL